MDMDISVVGAARDLAEKEIGARKPTTCPDSLYNGLVHTVVVVRTVRFQQTWP